MSTGLYKDMLFGHIGQESPLNLTTWILNIQPINALWDTLHYICTCIKKLCLYASCDMKKMSWKHILIFVNSFIFQFILNKQLNLMVMISTYTNYINLILQWKNIHFKLISCCSLSFALHSSQSQIYHDVNKLMPNLWFVLYSISIISHAWETNETVCWELQTAPFSHNCCLSVFRCQALVLLQQWVSGVKSPSSAKLTVYFMIP